MTKVLKNIRSNLVFQVLGGFAGLALYGSMPYFDSLEALGVFNQILAVHIISSQLGTLGLQFSMQQRIAAATDVDSIRKYASAGLAVVAVTALVCSLLLWLAAPLVERLFHTPSFAYLLAWSLPAFYFLNVNKVLLGINNGLHNMVLFGVVFGLRPCLYLLFYFVLSFLGSLGSFKLPLILCFSEALLFIILVANLDKSYLLKPKLKYVRDVSSFGVRSCMMGVFTELNTRLDVICIGIFLSDTAVGVYSVSLIVYEGVLQVLTIVRNNLNPIMASMIKTAPEKVGGLVEQVTKWVYPLFLGGFAFATISYILAAQFFPHFKLLPSFSVLLLLLVGVVAASGLFPFGALLIQADRPGGHSMVSVVAFFANLLLNVLLIPSFNLYGAAFATTFTLMVSHIIYFLLYRHFHAVNLFAYVWPVPTIRGDKA